MLFRLLDVNETSKYFKYTFCNDHTVQLVIKSKTPQNFTLYCLYEIKLSMGTEHVQNTLVLLKSKYLGVVLKRTRNSVHVQSGAVHFVFPLAIYNIRPGTDVWIVVENLNNVENK